MPLRAPFDVVPPPSWRRAAAALALGCATSVALAQVQPELPRIDAAYTDAPLIAADTRVLPVWSNSSGRVEALLLLDPSDAGPATSLDRVLAPRFGFGGRLRLDGGGEVRSSLQLEDAGLALLCEGRRGLAGTLGSLGERCLLAMLGHDDPLFGGDGRGARLELGWQSPERNVDLSFGLSWLDYVPQPAALLTGAALGDARRGAAELDALGFDGLGWNGAFKSQGVHLDSLINLGPQARVLLGGDVARNQLIGPDGTPLRWESAALSFGLGFGDFTGQLTGRLVELPHGGNPLSALDIGLSWRTPWRGELSVGAKNVLGTDTAAWPLAELPEIENSSARVPYVRYQQDL
jgi:hypothetical protein